MRNANVAAQVTFVRVNTDIQFQFENHLLSIQKEHSTYLPIHSNLKVTPGIFA